MAAVIRLDNFGEKADDGRGRVELSAALALGHGELAEEVFVDAAEGVVVEGGGDLGDLLQQLLEEGGGEEVVGLGEDASELRVVLLDVAHRLVDLGADVRGFGEVEEVVEAGVGGEVDDV